MAQSGHPYGSSLAAPSAPSNADDTDDTTYVYATTLIRIIVTISCMRLGEATGSWNSPLHVRTALSSSFVEDRREILSGYSDNRAPSRWYLEYCSAERKDKNEFLIAIKNVICVHYKYSLELFWNAVKHVIVNTLWQDNYIYLFKIIILCAIKIIYLAF